MTPETLRETVEKGGGRDNRGEENRKSPKADAALSLSSLRRTIDKSSTDGSEKWWDIPEVTLELCNELPRSSSCKLRSLDGRAVLLFVEVEAMRSCS